LSISADYYSISIKDVVGPIAGLSALNKCYNLDGSNPSYSAGNIYCTLISRDAGGQLSLIRAPYLNLGGLKTRGMDIAVNWSIPLSAMGIASSGIVKLGSDIGLMKSYQTAIFPGDAFVDSAGTNGAQASSLPKTKHTTTVGYQQGAAEVALNWQYLAAMKDRSTLTNPASTVIGSKAFSKFDLTGRFQLKHNLEVRAAISNLFDKSPPFASSGSYVDPAVYDIVGRAYTVGVRFKL
jgi:outer membrane receptor protein involved in Fe transport